uniref:CSAD n=1 Tax=Calidris pygmaea TaxID=425635 RepID=A0A8C3KBB0_9CHAR
MAESEELERPALDKATGEEFLREALQILLEEAVKKGTDVTQKVGDSSRRMGVCVPLGWGHLLCVCVVPPQVCEWKEPEELRELLDLELRNQGERMEKLLERCRDVIRLSVRTGHPRFFNQLFSGLDHHALAGRFITEALNTSQYTYEIAPVFVLMEEVVLAKLRELVGWSSGDGIFAPGIKSPPSLWGGFVLVPCVPSGWWLCPPTPSYSPPFLFWQEVPSPTCTP